MKRGFASLVQIGMAVTIRKAVRRTGDTSTYQKLCEIVQSHERFPEGKLQARMNAHSEHNHRHCCDTERVIRQGMRVLRRCKKQQIRAPGKYH